MRSKLSLTICLAAFAACVVAGTAVGQDEVVGSGEGAVEIDLPDGEQLEDLESLPACSNLADDDADQLVDLDDPECTSPLDTSESDSSAPTSGGAGGASRAAGTAGRAGRANDSRDPRRRDLPSRRGRLRASRLGRPRRRPQARQARR